MKNLEQQIGSPGIVVIGDDPRLVAYAAEQGIPVTTYSSDAEYRQHTGLQNSKTPSLGDFTRKSVLGAGYRVGASFAIDAIYLTTREAFQRYNHGDSTLPDAFYIAGRNFVQNLDPWKLGRVAAAVVAINFADYTWNITENLDSGARWLGKKVKSILGKKNNS